MCYITILDSNYFLLQSAQKSFLVFLSIRSRGSCVHHMPVYTFKRESLKGNYKVSDHEGRHHWEKDWLMQHELRAVIRKAMAVHRRERCCPMCLHSLPALANRITRSQHFWRDLPWEPKWKVNSSETTSSLPHLRMCDPTTSLLCLGHMHLKFFGQELSLIIHMVQCLKLAVLVLTLPSQHPCYTWMLGNLK